MRNNLNYIKKVHDNLKKIHSYLENPYSFYNFSELRRTVKCDSVLIAVLRESKILYKENRESSIKWNDKIPVSIRLAETIFAKTQEYYTKKRAERSSTTTVTPAEEESITPVVEKKIENKQIKKTTITRTFLWGLFKITTTTD